MGPFNLGLFKFTLSKVGSSQNSQINLYSYTIRKNIRVRQNEWEAYFNWYREDSKLNIEKITSLPTVDEKLTQTVSKLKKSSELPHPLQSSPKFCTFSIPLLTSFQ